ncbi:MAG TPA: DNA mismatch repair endonuclease MutL [Polyangiaceae bacterium]|nr:DNA mismatch repair endonuclease MutL [Polyangiaceae bacterium]
MTSTIHILPDALASQIAAGEVVERPASVVKELVENSLDANATRCDVSIVGGGVTKISVVDDGDGMSEADAKLCLGRLATSKLQRFVDLNSIASYGFRGEALPSIASVSRFTLRTRPRGAEAGLELKSDGGAEPAWRPVGTAPGTIIEVDDLFYNVPARRKFLRSTGTESGHVSETVELAALGRPDVSFTVTRDGRRARQWLRANGRAERVRQVLDDDELAQCLGERGPLRVEAYLSSPERARQGAQGLFVFVNNRPIRHRAVAASVAHAYGSVLERGRYPRGVVFLDLPPQLVDVNVHPQKAEVRFADPRAVTDALYSIVSKTLAQRFSLTPPERSQWSAEHRAATRTDAAGSVGTWSRPHGKEAAHPSGGESFGVAPREGAPEIPPPAPSPSANVEPFDVVLRIADEAPATGKVTTQWSALKFLAQVRQTYLVCEGPEGICVLDQHAAAERVMFSKLRTQYRAREVASQALLFPVTLQLAGDEIELLEEHGSEIRAMGLEVRVRGRDMVSVHSVPKLLQRGSAERLLGDLLTELGRTGARGFSDAVDKALATMACHAAVRAGDLVGRDEAVALLAALEGTDFAAYCPHGRPIVAFLSWAELERRVGRR